MFLLILVAFIGGAASVLTPCVLPLLPSILAFSTGEGRRRVWGIVAGIEFSFIVISLLLSAAFEALGLPPRTLELLAAGAMGVFGVILLVPPLEHAFQRGASRMVSRLPQRRSAGTGFWAGFAGGSSLGLVWAPCAGPILAGIVAAANSDGFTARTLLMTVAYGAGMFGPLFAIILGGSKLGARLRRALGGGSRVLAPMGLVLILTALVIGSGQLTKVTRAIAENINLTSTPTAALERQALQRSVPQPSASGSGRPSAEQLEANGYPSSDDLKLHDLGAAPPLRGINRWYNTPGGAPLDLKQLRGKVVLIDFWTYSCINCLRTLPHVRALHDRYADDGLVVIGVHTPEFDFERDEGNVARALRDLDVTWPVATDPDYATWRSYSNRFWPAKYLIDRDGTLRFVHYGEGEYAETEGLVRELLALKPMARKGSEPAPTGAATTPETYVGYGRAASAQWAGMARGSATQRPINDAPAEYRPIADAALRPDQFAVTGSWTVQQERAIADADGAHLKLRYRARNVYLVLGPPAAGSGRVRIHDSAGGARTIDIDGHRLYTLREGSRHADGILDLEVSKGVQAYAFTFG